MEVQLCRILVLLKPRFSCHFPFFGEILFIPEEATVEYSQSGTVYRTTWGKDSQKILAMLDENSQEEDRRVSAEIMAEGEVKIYPNGKKSPALAFCAKKIILI